MLILTVEFQDENVNYHDINYSATNVAFMIYYQIKIAYKNH